MRARSSTSAGSCTTASSGLGRHLDKVGRSLTASVTAYNQAVGTLETRVLVSARKLSALGGSRPS